MPTNQQEAGARKATMSTSVDIEEVMRLLKGEK